MNNEILLGLRKIKGISDYQFGIDITDILFDEIDNIRIERSKNTNKIRYIYYKNSLMLALRPTNGLFTLSLFSAKKIIENTQTPRLRAIILTEVSDFIRKGRNAFCKHIVNIDHTLRTLDEVIVVNQKDELLGIGRLKIPIPYIKTFKTGIAVNIRKGVQLKD
ncbi:MAG: pseudouridine synthase [Promethearchaeota archaeon]|nr:MAG: pseudouridine synthase [Candidatus Lokiarchaeota archaeon]